MDLIYTNANREDIGVLATHAFDLSYGASENDFELTLGANEPLLENNACVYIEGTEYGGMVGGMKTSTDGETVTYKGRTWHGILNSKIFEPDAGADYLVVSGDANAIISALIDRLGLSALFFAEKNTSGVNVSTYKFHRYCAGYEGLADMLSKNGGKLKIVWEGGKVRLSAEPIVDYTNAPIDGDTATLTVERNTAKVNHLICLGQGDLAEREVIHLYVDQSGKIGTTQYYTGLDEITATYENTNSEDLTADGIAELRELRNVDVAEMSVPETLDFSFDIGDIVSASDMRAGIEVSEAVTQKIVNIVNGIVTVDYKTGGAVERKSSSGGGSSGGCGGDVPSVEPYELPVASATTLGGVKVGDNLTITEDGTLSAPAPSGDGGGFETGTWTAGVNLGTITTQYCTYIKIGNMCTISFFIQGTGGSGTATTNFYITGSPFYPASGATWYGGGGHVQGLYDTSKYPVTGCIIQSSNKRIYFRTAEVGGTANGYIRANNGGAEFYLSGTITFPVAE